MNKMDEIKKRANTTALNQTAWEANYRVDVQYLLSIIEQAETALIQCRAYNNHPKYDGIRITEIVDNFFESIQGDE